MRLGSAIALALLLLVSARSARAEDAQDIPFTFGAAATYTVPISDAAGRFDTGRGFQVTLGYKFTDRLAVQGEFFQSVYDVKSDVLDANDVQGDHTLRFGSLDALFQFLPRSVFGVYAVGGPGLYYRRVRITRVEGVASAPFCDPWLFTCFSNAVPVGETLGSVSSMDFGLSGGLGVTVRYAGPLAVFAEARYHYIFGPKFNTPSGERRANGMYLPFILGVRF